MGWVKFLGTAGARFAMLRQLRYSAGTWLCLDEIEILIDPGPGTLLRARRARPPLMPERLAAIVLSHRHLDHAGDVNVMVEAMCGGRARPRGALLAPDDALHGDDPVVLRYVRPMLAHIDILREAQPQTIASIRLQPVRHHHAVITFGLVFEGNEGRIGFVVDGRCRAEAEVHYSGCDVLVLNVVRHAWNPDVDHLAFPEAVELIRAARPRCAVLTHFGTTMLRAGPRRLAEQASEATGIPVVAATDGLTLDFPLEGAAAPPEGR